MDTLDKWKNYTYYKGEIQNPFSGWNFGKAFWWTVEKYAVEAGDEKKPGKLSDTMVAYIRELHWEGPGHYDTTRTEMLERATELYTHGVWSSEYISIKRSTFQQAVKSSKLND